MWKLTLLDPPLLPVELLLVIGGVFSILPGLEIWMLPQAAAYIVFTFASATVAPRSPSRRVGPVVVSWDV